MKASIGALALLGAAIVGGCGSVAAEKTEPRTLPPSSVKVQTDPAPEFPDAFCGDPQRLLNTNRVAVTASYTERYRAEGPGCNAQWARRDNVVLERADTIGAWSRLTCARRSSASSPCVEYRTWEVTKVVEN